MIRLLYERYLLMLIHRHTTMPTHIAVVLSETDLLHQDGTLSMARSTDPNSASCQFFICLERNRATKGLDKTYTVFGQLIKGYDVLHKIGALECIPNPHNPREVSKPKEDVYLRKAFESDAEGNQI